MNVVLWVFGIITVLYVMLKIISKIIKKQRYSTPEKAKFYITRSYKLVLSLKGDEPWDSPLNGMVRKMRMNVIIDAEKHGVDLKKVEEDFIKETK